MFSRSEPREQSVKYLRGLLSCVERKNTWQIPEVVGDKIPDAIQRFLYRSPWDCEAARDLLQDFIIDEFGDPEAIACYLSNTQSTTPLLTLAQMDATRYTIEQ